MCRSEPSLRILKELENKNSISRPSHLLRLLHSQVRIIHCTNPLAQEDILPVVFIEGSSPGFFANSESLRLFFWSDL